MHEPHDPDSGLSAHLLPMLCGEIVGMLVGIGVSTALGMGRFRCSSLSCCQIMAGGVGEAIPLSIGYAALMHMDQGWH